MMRSIGRSRGLRALSVLASACALALTAVLSPVAPAAPAEAVDRKVTAADEAYYSRYNLASLHAQGKRGDGVVIALIDGRVDTSIPELQGADIEDKTPCQVTPDAESNDHATFLAQLLVAPDFGVAPGATLYSYAQAGSKREAGGDCNLGARSTAYADQSVLIEQALNDGVDIISISSNYASKDSESLKWAVARAAVDGVPIVGSMGNDGERNRTDRVGAWGSVVGVGALETDGRYADYSNYGDGVSIAAVGEMIARQASTNKIVTTAGTSNSAPLVAGVLALAWSDFDDGVTGYQILQALVATASGSGGKWNDRTGYGEVDPVALLASDPSRYPDENPFEEKQGDSVVTPDDIDDYNDGLVNPSSVYNDDTYVYRGLDEQVVSSGASGYPAHLGTSPRYHAQ
jgi:hypothetical protein